MAVLRKYTYGQSSNKDSPLPHRFVPGLLGLGVAELSRSQRPCHQNLYTVKRTSWIGGQGCSSLNMPDTNLHPDHSPLCPGTHQATLKATHIGPCEDSGFQQRTPVTPAPLPTVKRSQASMCPKTTHMTTRCPMGQHKTTSF